MQKQILNLVRISPVLLVVAVAAQKGFSAMKFSPAHKDPHVMEIHGDKRVDNYFWMKERDSKPVLDYLKEENERTAQALKPFAKLEKKLFDEIKSRITEDDSTVPAYHDGYYYYSRFEKGKEYPIHCRKAGALDAPEEVYLDENKMAAGVPFLDIGGINPSNDQKLLAYAIDTVGRRLYTLRVRDLKTGRDLDDKIENISPHVVWANDNRTLFYAKQDLETLRPYQVYRYELGSGKPELIYEEKDATFNLGVGDSKTQKHLFIFSTSYDATEIRALDANKPKGDWKVLSKRESKHEYSVFDGGDRFYILTNWKAKNFRLMESDYSAHDKSLWKEVIPHNPKVLLEDLDVNAKYLVLSSRENGLQQLEIVNRSDLTSRRLEFADPSYEAGNVSLPDYKSAYMRFSYESLAQPRAVYDEDFASQKRVLRKERVVAGYDKKKYEVKRIWAAAQDGAQIPISILKKKATQLDGKSPALVYSYGSYGISNDVYFRGSILSLVDRGFVFALPHIRGGSEMGRDWYEQGRLNHKMNTFTDFIAATEKLIADGYTSKGHVYAEGGSAGGLLMGAVANMRPELYKGIVAEVPFVDVLTTMLDDTIPLTSGEYSQWGDPHNKDDYFYMKRYSPYDNVEKKAYPAMYVSTGYHDSQVQYWEPAKWVAKLREMKTDKNPLLLYTDFSAGHGGASGRYESIKTIAKPFTFMLMIEGIKD